MSTSSKLASVRRTIDEHPEIVIVGGAVLVVVGFKVGHAKPKPTVNKEFAKRMGALLKHLENGRLESGDLFFDTAYSQGVWDSAKEFRKVLETAKKVK